MPICTRCVLALSFHPCFGTPFFGYAEIHTYSIKKGIDKAKRRPASAEREMR